MKCIYFSAERNSFYAFYLRWRNRQIENQLSRHSHVLETNYLNCMWYGREILRPEGHLLIFTYNSESIHYMQRRSKKCSSHELSIVGFFFKPCLVYVQLLCLAFLHISCCMFFSYGRMLTRLNPTRKYNIVLAVWRRKNKKLYLYREVQFQKFHKFTSRYSIQPCIVYYIV